VERNLRNFIFITSIVLLGFIFLTSCEKENPKPIIDNIDTVEVKKDTIPVIEDPYPLITYTLDTIKDLNHRRELFNRFQRTGDNFAAFKAFTTLNRKELRYMGVGSAVVIPDSIHSDLKAYSVFPDYYHGARNIPKIVIVSNEYLSYGAYEYGKLVKFSAVNSGKERTPSFPGRYAVTWKKKEHRSSIDSNWVMPYTINFHPQAGSAFHKFEMPGKPASHSCVRQFMDDAEWLYYWVDLAKYDNENKRYIPFSGTPVIIIDHYDHAPGVGYKWKYIKDNKFKIDYLPEDPMAVEEAIIPISQIPLDARGSLRDYNRFLYGEDTLRARGIIRPGVRLIETRNFNKERREKAKKEAARLEKQKQDSIKRAAVRLDSIKRVNPILKDTNTKIIDKPDTLKIIRYN